MSLMSATEKLFGTTTLDERQVAMAKRTYALLSLSIVGAMVGGYTAVTNESMALFFSRPLGWILALIGINLIPSIALWAAARSPALGLIALVADGFLSAIALSPLLYIANMVAPQMIPAAGAVTLAVFVAVTGYIMVTRDRFSGGTGLMTGIVASVFVAILVNSLFLHSGLLAILISAAVGVFGVFILVYATSEVLNNPDFDNPVRGALMLFAALFNIFSATLRLLLSFTSRD